MRLVTLIDGRTVPSDSEEHRHECEARHILALPNLTERRTALAEREKRRGKAATDQLKATMKELWKR